VTEGAGIKTDNLFPYLATIYLKVKASALRNIIECLPCYEELFGKSQGRKLSRNSE
jgi:hypothetical protein